MSTKTVFINGVITAVAVALTFVILKTGIERGPVPTQLKEYF